MNERRAVWTAKHGPIPKGWVVHNLNGDKGDNRIENLAAVPRRPDNVQVMIAPYVIRIRNLEKELEFLKEKLK